MATRRWIRCSLGLMAAAVAVAGCGKKKSSGNSGLGEGASITITGQLALENSSTTAALALSDLNATGDVALADLKVYCVSFAFPPKAGTGSVDANGNFSLSIDANGVAIGCFVLKGTETLASMVFEDTSSKDVDGDSKSDARLAFSGNTNMGQIKLDTATGKAKADVSKFKSSVKAFAGGGFDFTGTWILKATDNLPEGYSTVTSCNPQTQKCEGPAEGMSIYLHRIAGKRVADNSDAYAIAIWKSKTAFTNCGQKLGFLNNDAKTKVGIDFSVSGLGDGALVWEQGWEQGWKFNGAQTPWPMPMCSQDKINGIEVTKCSGTVGGAPAYSLGVNTRESGCRYDDGSFARIDDWKSVTWNQSTTPCTDFAAIPGLKMCSNTGSYGGRTVTCKGVGGVFDASNPSVQPIGQFTPATPYEGACASAPGGELQKLQCYANHYFKNRESSGDKCIADVQLNWGAQTANEFVMRSDGPSRSTNQFVMNLLSYSSETTAAVHDDKTYFRGIPSGSKDGGNSFVNCKFIESTDMALNKLSDNEVLIELIQKQKSVDQNPICGSQTGGENGMTKKFMFKAVKQ